MLAEFGAALAELPTAQPRGEFLDRLGDMLVVGERLVDQRSSLRPAFSEVGDPLSKTAGPRILDRIDKDIDRCDREIRKLIEGEAAHAESCRIPASIPGVGPAAAAALICWMSELGTIGGRQAASLIGAAPAARDSGTMKGMRHVRGGRQPCDVLCMPPCRCSFPRRGISCRRPRCSRPRPRAPEGRRWKHAGPSRTARDPPEALRTSVLQFRPRRICPQPF